ncbi:MAG: hypothetical protein U9Q07_07425 [Planctomycetota bacterium]|nr:hypothetical protein [Planctomycetota bacterium]
MADLEYLEIGSAAKPVAQGRSLVTSSRYQSLCWQWVKKDKGPRTNAPFVLMDWKPGQDEHLTATHKMQGPLPLKSLPEEVTLTGNPRGFPLDGISVSRHRYMNNYTTNELEQRVVQENLNKIGKPLLETWAGIIRDVVFFHSLSLGRENLVQTSSDLNWTSLRSLDTFRENANQPDIGTSDAATAYKKYNVVFADSTGGLVSTAGGDTWTNMGSGNRLTIASLRRAKLRARMRGVQPLMLKVNGSLKQTYIIVLEDYGIAELREDDEFNAALLNAEVRGAKNPYWNGWGPTYVLDGMLIYSATCSRDGDDTYLTNQTVLRSEEIAGTSLAKFEGHIIGDRCLVVDDWRSPRYSTKELDHDGMQTQSALRFHIGAAKIPNVLEDSTADTQSFRERSMSLCYVADKEQ